MIEHLAAYTALFVSLATGYATFRNARIGGKKTEAEADSTVVEQYDKLVDRYLAEIGRLIAADEKRQAEHKAQITEIHETYKKEIHALKDEIQKLKADIGEQTAIIIEQTKEIQKMKLRGNS